jgi:hypothetical protein
MTPVWQRHRSAFNHDWLKNHYMPALAKWLNLLDGKIRDASFEHSYLKTLFPEWESHLQEGLALIQGFEGEMVPSSLFSRPPLSRCDEDTKDWLPALADALWRARYPVTEWVPAAGAAASTANASYEELARSVRAKFGSTSAEELRRLRGDFAEFHARCQALATAIEKFPSRMMVT